MQLYRPARAIDYEAVSVMHFTNTYTVPANVKAFCKTLAMTVTVITTRPILGIQIYSPSECLWIVI
jgi:hypothetical protein